MKMPTLHQAWKVRPFEQDYVAEDFRGKPVFRPCGDTPEERKDVAETICETMNEAEWTLYICNGNAARADFWMHECLRLRSVLENADLMRALLRIEREASGAIGKGPEIASLAIHQIHTYAASAIRAAQKKEKENAKTK